ncbi:hypothetical protein CYA84_03900 [Campylobacter coli]|nr:hypothetical protein [Campylobacter coli]
MNFKEVQKTPARGYFCIESLDANGNIIDKFEQKNLITNIARAEFAKLIAGINESNAINRFVMGTKGHQGSDILTPKDETTGFTASVTDIFSGQEEGDINRTWNQVIFTPSGNMVNTAATNVQDGANNNSTVDITVTGIEQAEPVVTYTINIAQDAFNCANDGVVYTEAGLYSGDKLIAMRTFKGKVKESTVAFRIQWSVMF